MNRTFKVCFNKARGALMVVNEITSSVQAKGTKTVVAAAVASALMAGAAGLQAAESPELVLDWDTVTIATDGYKLPTFKFHSGKGQVTHIQTNADANKLFNDLIANDKGLNGILTAIGQVDSGKKTGILAGFAGGYNFWDAETASVLNLGKTLLDADAIDKLKQQMVTFDAKQFELLHGDTNILIGGSDSAPVLIGSVGGDRIVNANVKYRLFVSDFEWKPDPIAVTREGSSNVEIQSGNLLGHVNGSSAINVGLPMTVVVKTGSGTKVGAVKMAAGSTSSVLTGDSTLNITGTGCAAGAFAGGSAIALGGTANSEVRGNSTIVLNNTTKNEPNGSINTLSVGLVGGGLSVATLGGSSSSTVAGMTTIELQKGLAIGVLGGGAALAFDPTDVYDKVSAEVDAFLKENKKDDNFEFQIDDNLKHATGTATATSGDVGIKVGSGATVAGIVGGGLAGSYQYGDASASATSKATVGDVVIQLGDTVETGKALTDEEKGKLFKTVKDLGTAIQTSDKDLSKIKTAALDFVQKIDDFEGVTVGVVGGGIAAAWDRNRGSNNGDFTAKATSTVNSVGIQVNSGYNVALVGGGIAAGSGHSKTGEDLLASANVTGDVVMNFAGGETIGVMGGGAAIWTGSDEAHDGIGAEANVRNVKLNVVGGDVDGIFGGGLAVDDTNPLKGTERVPTKNASAHVNTVTINAQSGNIGRLAVDSFEHIQNQPGSDTAQPGMVQYLKDALNGIEAKKVAILAGGMSGGMRADGDLKVTAGSVVDKATIVLGGTTVVGEENDAKRGNVFGGGFAVAGAGAYVGESNIQVSGATINGDIYGGGIAVGGKYTDPLYNNAASEVGTSNIILASGTLNGDLHVGGLTYEPDGASAAKSTVKTANVTLAKDFVFKGKTIDGSGADKSSLTILDGYDFQPVDETPQTRDAKSVVITGFDDLNSTGAVTGASYDFGGKDNTTVNGVFDFESVVNGADKTMTIESGAVAVKGTYDNAFDVDQGVLALGSDATTTAAIDAMGLYAGDAALYLSGTVDLTNKHITIGKTDAADGVTIGSNGMLIVDASVTGNEEEGKTIVTEVTGKVNGEDGSALHFVNVADQGLVKVETTIDPNNWTVDNVLFEVKKGDNNTYSFDVVTDAGKLDDLGLSGFDGNALGAISKQDDAASEAIKDLLDQTNGAVTSGDKRHAQINAALNLAAAGGVQTAGIETAMMGVDKATKRASLTNVFNDGWTGFAEVTGTQLKLGGDRGALETKTELGGIAVGGEYTVGDMTFGVLGNFGTGDVKGEGDNGGVKNDVDYYGIQAYAGKRFGQFNVVGQMGYVMTDNDIKHDFGDEVKVDADVFTIGARGEMAWAINDKWTAVPYVGLNYLRVATDGYTTKTGFKVGSVDQNLVNLPIGVAVAGDCSVHGGWTVRPTVDVAYVRTFGDTDLDATTGVGATNIGTTLDVWSENVGRLNVGVEARKDNMAFGFSFGGAVGDMDHSEIYGQLNAKYVF